MTKQIAPVYDNSWLIVGAAIVLGTVIVAALTGCATDQPVQPRGYLAQPAVQVQASVAVQDDYDYYPGYETYYNRNRNEYVYRDGDSWVHRPEPAGVTASALLTAPKVRLDFHDAPEQHHSAVVQQYPKNWKAPEAKRDEPEEKKDEKK